MFIKLRINNLPTINLGTSLIFKIVSLLVILFNTQCRNIIFKYCSNLQNLINTF